MDEDCRILNRRDLLTTGVASAIVNITDSNLMVVAAEAPHDDPATSRDADDSFEITSPDGLNPPNIRTAGIRMVPVVDGKYKVWTKRMGRGAVKVLLLHGGSGFSHEYLESMESFLPQAGIEMHYYDQLGCNNSDQPNDRSLWTLAAMSRR